MSSHNVITPGKRAELRAKRQARKAARDWERRNEESRSWTKCGGGRDDVNCRVPGWEKMYIPSYTPAQPAQLPKRKKRKKSRGRSHNGVIERIGCNSEYARGNNHIPVGKLAPRNTQGSSYTEAVQHGMVVEK